MRNMLFPPLTRNVEPWTVPRVRVYRSRFNVQLSKSLDVNPLSSGLLVHQGHGHEDMRLVADDAGGVTFAAGVVGEHDIAGFEGPLHTITRFDFPRTGKCHEELATRRRVAIQRESHWSTTKNGTRSRARVGR